MAKKNQRLFALLLIFIMIISTACGSSEEIKQPANVNSDSSVTTTAEPDDSTSESIEEETVANEITIAETVLYDANDVKVTAIDYEDGWMGPEVKVLIDKAYAHCKQILEENADKLQQVVAFLLENESMTGAQFADCMEGAEIRKDGDMSLFDSFKEEE